MNLINLSTDVIGIIACLAALIYSIKLNNLIRWSSKWWGIPLIILSVYGIVVRIVVTLIDTNVIDRFITTPFATGIYILLAISVFALYKATKKIVNGKI